MVYQQRPSTFTDEILYPEHSEKILDTLHFLLNGEVGRGAALVMVCARDEGLVRNIAHAKISTEFKHVSKPLITTIFMNGLLIRRRIVSSVH